MVIDFLANSLKLSFRMSYTFITEAAAPWLPLRQPYTGSFLFSSFLSLASSNF